MTEKIQELLAHGIDDADIDKDGYLSKEEFQALMKSANEENTDLYISRLFGGLDVDKEGKVQLSNVKEYFTLSKTYLETEKPPLELVKIWYRSIDVNNDSKVNLEELRDFLYSQDKTMTTHAAAVKLRKMDADSNGTISFQEFAASYGYETKKLTKSDKDAYNGKSQSQCCYLI